MRAGPSGEEWGTPHYTRCRLSSVPSGDRSANPASVPGRSGPQRALLSVSPTRKRSGTERPTERSLEQLKQPSPAGPPLQGTELAALSAPEASLERLVPLVDYLAAWKLLPNVSRWVLHTVERGFGSVLRRCLQRGHSHTSGSRAGAGNGTRSECSLEEGGHRGGPSS